MTTPAETILNHLAEVRDAFSKSPGPAGAWSLLQSTCPALTAAMSVNTFKVLAPAIVLTAERLTAPPPPPEPTPKTFGFWTVGTDQHGYVRLHRRMAGRLRSVYIGKGWDSAKARERVAECERRIADAARVAEQLTGQG